MRHSKTTPKSTPIDSALFMFCARVEGRRRSAPYLSTAQQLGRACGYVGPALGEFSSGSVSLTQRVVTSLPDLTCRLPIRPPFPNVARVERLMAGRDTFLP